MDLTFRKILLLFFASMMSMSLLIGRMEYTGTKYFSFLKWNLLLGIIPFCISLFIFYLNKKNQLPVLSLLWIIWLAFLPNSFYIITDLVHLKTRSIIPIWYDAAMLLSFGWTGLYAGSLSIMFFDRYLTLLNFTQKSKYLIILSCLMLCGIGCYVGRYLRWNSWDLAKNPSKIYFDLLNTDLMVFGIFSLLFGVFFLMVYYTFRFGTNQ